MEHNTSTSDVVPIEERVWYKNVKVLGSTFRWAVVLMFGITGYYVYQRDVNAANVASLEAVSTKVAVIERTMSERRTERDKQIDGLQKQMLTREVFEAYHSADAQRMDRMEKMMEQMLEHQR